MLDSDQKRQFSIWLSRYCLHPEQTTRTIEEVLLPKDTVENDPDTAVLDRQKPQPDLKLQQNVRNKPGLIVNLKTMLHKLWGRTE